MKNVAVFLGALMITYSCVILTRSAAPVGNEEEKGIKFQKEVWGNWVITKDWLSHEEEVTIFNEDRPSYDPVLEYPSTDHIVTMREKDTGTAVRYLVYPDHSCENRYGQKLNKEGIRVNDALHRCVSWGLCQAIFCNSGYCFMQSPTCKLMPSVGRTAYVIKSRVPPKMKFRESLKPNLLPLDELRRGRDSSAPVENVSQCDPYRNFDWSKFGEPDRSTDPESIEYPYIEVTQRDHNQMKQSLIDPVHKLVFFQVQKVMSQNLFLLVDRLLGHRDVVLDANKTMKVYALGSTQLRPRMQLGSLTLTQANQIMNDPSWKKVMFFRDPTERYLSFWMNKILIQEKPFDRLFGLTTFTEQVDHVMKEGPPPYGNGPSVNVHYKQFMFFYNIYKFLPQMDFLAWGTSESVEIMLKKYDLWEEFGSDDLWPRGFMRNGGNHATGSTSKADQYYTPELLKRVSAAYEVDYGLLNYIGLKNKSSLPTTGRHLKSIKQQCCAKYCQPVST